MDLLPYGNMIAILGADGKTFYVYKYREGSTDKWIRYENASAPAAPVVATGKITWTPELLQLPNRFLIT